MTQWRRSGTCEDHEEGAGLTQEGPGPEESHGARSRQLHATLYKSQRRTLPSPEEKQMSMAYTSWASISISGTFWTSSPWAIVLLPSITNLAKGNTTYTWGRATEGRCSNGCSVSRAQG